MLMRTDPFRELDRLTQQVLGNVPGTWSRPTAMPMDAYRVGDEFVVVFDLPGVSPEAIDLDVERNVVTVKAERRPTAAGDGVEMQVAERPLGVFSRQLFLGDTLDIEHVTASYDAGVLTLRIPVAEQAKLRKIEISAAESERQQINALPCEPEVHATMSATMSTEYASGRTGTSSPPAAFAEVVFGDQLFAAEFAYSVPGLGA